MANGYLARVVSRIAALDMFPDRGALRLDLDPTIRALSFERRLLILYRVHENRVRIVRVVDARRDLADLPLDFS